MKAYEATSEIQASPEAIWTILVDGANYPAWESGMVDVSGTGPLLGMMWRSMPDHGPSFSQFARGLKARAERSAGA
jgi:hypothetical protein